MQDYTTDETSTWSLPAPRKRTADEPDERSYSTEYSDAIDSMRPVVPAKPRKKRRRTITDAMHSINLESGDDEDADSSQAVADTGDEGGYSTTSSLADDETQSSDERLLSDKEIDMNNANRKIMLELVFGATAEIASDGKDPVDRKLNEMIQNSILQATAVVRNTQDDMHIDTAYSKPSDSIRPVLRRTNSMNDFTTSSDEIDMDTSD